jgi:TonB family protein
MINLFIQKFKKYFMRLFFFIITIVSLNALLFAQDGLVKSYYPNGNPESEINYNNNIREGEAKFYYEDGTLKEERFYVNGRVEGLVKVYHPNGNLKELINIEDGRREGPSSVFDEEGNYEKDIFFSYGIRVVEKKNPYIIEQPGTEIAVIENNETTTSQPVRKLREQNYEFPPPQEVEELEDDPAIFRTVEIMPEPVGGYETIKKKLIYPAKAKENGIEGIVEVEVTIDEFGEVTSAEVKKGIGYGCDEAARTAVFYTKFKPALQRGRPVKVQTVIPVEFKLLDEIRK